MGGVTTSGRHVRGRSVARRAALLAALALGTPAAALAVEPPAAETAAATLSAAMLTPAGWSGDAQRCAVGGESAASLDATLRAVNAFRSVANLHEVTLDPALSARALGAAVLMLAGNTGALRRGLTHAPDPSWPCVAALPDAVAAAGISNLALGTSGAAAIRAFIDDDGVARLGHRRWLLDPAATTFGSGSTGLTAALLTIGGTQALVPSGTTVPWPPAGAIAADWIPATWSVSVGGTGDAVTLVNPTVTMTLDGQPLAVSPVADLGVGYGTGRALGWTPQLDRAALRGRPHLLSVAVDGFVVNGAAFPLRYATQLGTVPPPTPPPPPLPTPAPLVLAAPAAPQELRPLTPWIAHRRGAVRRKMRLTARFASGTHRIVTRVRWLRDGKAIKGAHSVRHVVSRADAGHKLRVRITSQAKDGSSRLTERSKAIKVRRAAHKRRH